MVWLFLEPIVYFFAWTLVLYWIHRLCHGLDFLRRIHLDHHGFINSNGNGKSRWEINNCVLYNDSKHSTIDLWLTEVIPTVAFSAVTGQWWICIFYYVWAAFFQEIFEHRRGFDLFLLTPGEWHLQHHRNCKVNYSLFFPVWDIIFGTYHKHD